jgi:predicted phage tail protein
MIQRMLLDTYLAIPYRHHGRSDQGIDCWGMFKRYYKDHFDIDIPEIDALAYDEDGEWNDKQVFIDACCDLFDPVEQPQEHDVIVFSMPGHENNHIGIYVGDGQFLHACRAGVVLTRLSDPTWSSRVASIHRWKARISVKYVPNVLDKAGRYEKTVLYARHKPLERYLQESGIDHAGKRIIVSGKAVQDMSIMPAPGDEIIVTPAVAVEAIVAAATWLIANWQAVLTVLYIGYSLYAANAAKKRRPNVGSGTGMDADSPTYDWNGIRTMQDVNIPVAIPYGTHRNGGNVVNAWIRNDGDKNYLYALLALGEGEVEDIDDIYINENPQANYDGITLKKRYGRNQQSVIPNFEDSHNMYDVGVTLTQYNPHTYTTIDSDVEGADIHLQLAGLFQQDQTTGEVLPWSVTVNVQYKLHSSPLWQTWDNFTYSAKSQSTLRRVVRITGLPPGQYDFKVERTSEDTTLDPMKQGDLTWTQIDEIKTDDFEYPNTALLAIEALAHEQLNGSMPNVTSLVKGRRVRVPAINYSGVPVDWSDYYWDPTLSGYYRFSDDALLSWDAPITVENARFDDFSSGNFDDWTLSGTGAAVAAETAETYLKRGRYTAKLTRASADAALSQSLADFADYQGESVAVGVWVLCGIGDRARISVTDGFTTQNSSYHTGNSAWQYLSVTINMNAGATELTISLQVNTGEASAYFSHVHAYHIGGEGYEERWSGNPIWCIRDLILNTRYGMGEFISSATIDESLYLTMSRYCEEKVDDGDSGYEKRFVLDCVIDSPTRALDLVGQLCQSFRSFTFYSGGVIKIRIDKNDSPVQLFGMGNIIKDSFSQSWKSIKSIVNSVDVQFLDADKNFQQDTAVWEDADSIAAGDPIRTKSVRLFVTRISQALREARFIGLANKYLTRQITFKAGIDAIACEPGDVISVSHDVPQWGYSGRVVAGTSNTITLDQNVTIAEGTTYKVLVQHNDDTQEELTVTTLPGTTATLTVSGTFATTPAAYENYVFGPSTMVKKDFRVMTMERDRNNEVTITALEMNANIYDDTAPTIPDDKYSSLDISIPAVSDLDLTERVVTKDDGSLENTIDVWFDKPPADNYVRRYAKARIYLSEDNSTWEARGETYGSSFSIQGGILSGETYYVKVVSVTDDNEEGTSAPTDSITIAGKTTPPATPANFASDFSNDLSLTWDKNAEKDVILYEIRDEDANWGVDNANRIYRGLANEFRYRPSSRTPGTLYIKAINRSGIYSTTAASVTPTNSAPPAPTVTANVFFNIARLSWTDGADDDLEYYEVYKSRSNAWAGEEELITKASGTSCMIDAREPRGSDVTVGTVDTIQCDGLVGYDDDYFNQMKVTVTSGAAAGEERVISDFDGTTGTLTLATSLTAAPSAGDTLMIRDRVFIKVRGVDIYGPGTLSSSVTVEFDNLTEDALGDNVVTARKIYVACLSALSANLGLVTAGVIQGGTIQTADTGARTVFDQYGIRSYDDSDNVTFEVHNGYVCAYTLKLIDPGCNCNFSYLDNGELKFHDILGAVPYVKRLCNGEVMSGGKVSLLGWTSAPKVQVSVKSLSSYDPTMSAQCQRWCVYATAPEAYCNAVDDYGYCFHACAVLNVSGGASIECLRSLPLGTSFCTDTCVCSVSLKHSMQYWCVPAAPSCYSYGTVCYAVLYRVAGSGTWCSTCFSYVQPHDSAGALKSNGTACAVLPLPCMANWEISSCVVSLYWTATTIPYADAVNCVCTRTFGGASVSCYQTFSSCTACTASAVACTVVAGSMPSHTYCTMICYNWASIDVGHLTGYVNYAVTNQCTYAYACAGVYANADSGYALLKCCWACYGTVSGQTCCCVVAWDANGVVAVPSYDYSTVRLCAWMGGRACRCGGGIGRADICLCGGCIIHCYTCYLGGAAACCFGCLHTSQEIYGCYCVLDTTGVLNWLAVSYS